MFRRLLLGFAAMAYTHTLWAYDSNGEIKEILIEQCYQIQQSPDITLDDIYFLEYDTEELQWKIEEKMQFDHSDYGGFLSYRDELDQDGIVPERPSYYNQLWADFSAYGKLQFNYTLVSKYLLVITDKYGKPTQSEIIKKADYTEELSAARPKKYLLAELEVKENGEKKMAYTAENSEAAAIEISDALESSNQSIYKEIKKELKIKLKKLKFSSCE